MPAKGKVEEPSWFFLATASGLPLTSIMLAIFVNNQSYSLPSGALLAHALEKTGVGAQRGIAVAINNSVVPKSEWNSRALSNNDKITIIKATQGG